jgi:hypothetical protein
MLVECRTNKEKDFVWQKAVNMLVSSEEKNGERAACLKYSVLIVVKKIYIKCNVWRVAVHPSYI